MDNSDRMNKVIGFFLVLVLFSCNTQKVGKGKVPPVFKVLKTETDGGAQIEFCEVLSEEQELKILLNDDALKNKIKPADIKTSNFLILNMGEKPTGGYGITVDRAEERMDSIVIYVKKTVPKAEDMVTQVITYPYCVVKINSKKGIILK